VGLLERFEDSLDRLVNGAFARAFKAEVQPVEIASALQREIGDRAAVIDRQRTVIPNVFHVELSEHDYRRLAVFKEALQTELATLVRDYGAEQRYTLLGPVQVNLGQDDELETGIFRVRSEARAEVRAAGSQEAVSVDTRQPRLEVAGTAYPLVRAITRLGRGSDTDIRIEDPGASRNHCEIVLGSPVLVRDLDSTNGTFVNGQRISQVEVTDGTAIVIGTTQLVFRSG
jgi:FhaA, N-terminal domain/FHA domain